MYPNRSAGRSGYFDRIADGADFEREVQPGCLVHFETNSFALNLPKSRFTYSDGIVAGSEGRNGIVTRFTSLQTAFVPRSNVADGDLDCGDGGARAVENITG